MSPLIDLLRREARARRFLLAHGQSSLGTGAGYTALLLLTYRREASPWALAIVLLADLLPSTALGPLLGAAADRWSRRATLVAADLLRAGAFAGIALVDSLLATIAFALVAGLGTGLWTPSVLAALPGLVAPERRTGATSVYGMVSEAGWTVGAGLAGIFLLVAGPEALLLVNAATFLVSAAVISRLSLAAPVVAAPAGPRPNLLREAWAGVRVVGQLPGIRPLILASGAAALFAATINVGELFLALEEVAVGASGFSAFVAASSLGIIVGSLAGARERALRAVKRRFLAGLALVAAGILVAGFAESLLPALAGLGLLGVGNGLVIVHGRLLVQASVSHAVVGRVFGVHQAAVSAGLGFAFALGAGLISLVGTRGLFVIAGVGVAATWAATALALRRSFADARPARPEGPALAVEPVR